MKNLLVLNFGNAAKFNGRVFFQIDYPIVIT
jgi:hypothetical protein